VVPRAAHLGEDFVQPLEGAMQVHLYPTGGGRNVLSVILGPPPLHERHPNGAHLSKFIDRLKPMVHRLCQERRKFLVIEDLQAATWWNFAYCGRVEPMVIVAVSGLDKNSRIGQAFCVHFSTYVIQVNTFSDVPPSVFNGGVPVHIGQLAQTEPVVVLVRWVREPVYYH